MNTDKRRDILRLLKIRAYLPAASNYEALDSRLDGRQRV